MTESSISRNRKDSDKKKSQKLKYRGVIFFFVNIQDIVD